MADSETLVPLQQRGSSFASHQRLHHTAHYKSEGRGLSLGRLQRTTTAGSLTRDVRTATMFKKKGADGGACRPTTRTF